jgi:hypothetical protein
MGEKAGRLVTIKVSGDAVAFTTEATSTEDNIKYQIDDTSKRVWDRDTTPTIYDDGVETSEDYTVNKLEGTITFESADEIRVITVSGKYLPMSTASYAHEYSYARGVDLIDVSKFGDTYKSRIADLKYASGTISQWDVTDTYFEDALTAGDPVVLEFRDESTSDPIRCWALLESREMAAALGNAQDEIVSFISTDELLDLE